MVLLTGVKQNSDDFAACAIRFPHVIENCSDYCNHKPLLFANVTSNHLSSLMQYHIAFPRWKTSNRLSFFLALVEHQIAFREINMKSFLLAGAISIRFSPFVGHLLVCFVRGT